MARVSSLTVFTVVTLVCYTILGTAIYSVFAGTTFSDPYGGKVAGWEYAEDYLVSEAQNMTKNSATYFTVLDPDRVIDWWATLKFYRKGTNWWDSWLLFEMSGSPRTEAEIIADFDTDKNYTKYIFDEGGDFETHAFIYCKWSDGTGSTYDFYPIADSIANNELTIVLASDAQYPSYDIGILIGILTGFYFYGAPFEISVIIGGIWWALCLLTLVKLVVG